MKQPIVIASAVLFSFVHSFTLVAQDQSVRPGINDRFQNATPEDLSNFVERFEREGREIYDLRMEIVAACRLRPAMCVADIGAGTGLFSRLMAPSVGKLVAVDINQAMLDHVVAKSKEDGLSNVATVLCDQQSCKLPEKSIDVAFVCDTYHHFEFPYRTMRSIRRALKPNGVLVLVEFDRIEGKSSEWILNHVRADRETFTREIEVAGFEETDLVDDIFKKSYLKRFKVSNRIDERGFTTDSLEDIKKGLADKSAVLIDVRSQKEWDQGHLKAASFFPFRDAIQAATEKKKVDDKIPSDQIVYLHCRVGGRAKKVAAAFKDYGFDLRPIPQGFEKLVESGFDAAEQSQPSSNATSPQ